MAEHPPRSLDLGIDTASDDVSLALLDAAGQVVAESAWRVAGTVALELLAGLDALLERAGVTREQIGRIAVDAGPGQYGQVRTGIATAQGLALGLDIPLAGVDRLEADAWRHLAPGATVVAVHDAGRAGIAWAAYADAGPDAAPRLLVAARLDAPEVAAHEAPRPATWCGETTPALEAARDAEGRSGDTVAGPAATSRAVALVRLARWHGAFGDPAGVDARYLRPPSITPPRPRV